MKVQRTRKYFYFFEKTKSFAQNANMREKIWSIESPKPRSVRIVIHDSVYLNGIKLENVLEIKQLFDLYVYKK